MHPVSRVTTGCDAVVVGGGLVGLAVARELATTHRLRVLLVEREHRVAAHQSGHNSGVVHSGLYYRPGSQKSRTCAAGRELLLAYAAERRIAHERCGKLVVALTEDEVPRLEELERRGHANGLAGVERLDAAGVRAAEPHAAGIAGLWVPETGIIDYPAVAAAFAEDVATAGGEVRLGAGVTAIRHRGERLEIEAGGERIETGLLVGCAGLASDRIARLAGLRPEVRIVPFRGDYFELLPAARQLVRNLIYPVPDPELPFLGVHLTRRIDGSVEAGPNAVLAWKREAYRAGAFSVRYAWSTLAYPGFWRMARRQVAVAGREYRRAWSRSSFAAALARLVPELAERDLRPAGCGVRAQAVDRQGKLVDDFVFAEAERMLHVLNAPSPAATASMAIGKILAERAVAQLGATPAASR